MTEERLTISCSWCRTINTLDEKWCNGCGHRADVQRSLCDCARCEAQLTRLLSTAGDVPGQAVIIERIRAEMYAQTEAPAVSNPGSLEDVDERLCYVGSHLAGIRGDVAAQAQTAGESGRGKRLRLALCWLQLTEAALAVIREQLLGINKPEGP